MEENENNHCVSYLRSYRDDNRVYKNVGVVVCGAVGYMQALTYINKEV